MISVLAIVNGVLLGVVAGQWWRERRKRKEAEKALHKANQLALKAVEHAEEAETYAHFVAGAAVWEQTAQAQRAEAERKAAMGDALKAQQDVESTLPWYFTAPEAPWDDPDDPPEDTPPKGTLPRKA